MPSGPAKGRKGGSRLLFKFLANRAAFHSHQPGTKPSRHLFRSFNGFATLFLPVRHNVIGQMAGSGHVHETMWVPRPVTISLTCPKREPTSRPRPRQAGGGFWAGALQEALHEPRVGGVPSHWTPWKGKQTKQTRTQLHGFSMARGADNLSM